MNTTPATPAAPRWTPAESPADVSEPFMVWDAAISAYGLFGGFLSRDEAQAVCDQLNRS